MRFAFIIMGDFDYKKDRAGFADGAALMVGVSSVEDACAAAKELQAAGFGCLELCGAFGEDGARKVIEATGNQVPVGYITHLPEQDDLYQAVFSS